ncbi:unnamed protein product [Dovyalis caffra]|uniref:Ribosomal protein L2 n=1 Tax=Dovyalis caffra TaxID=77055 RepID=A0AAV1S5G7_9ROSI|nr:unnamed protein product [Dovyalis caffra]
MDRAIARLGPCPDPPLGEFNIPFNTPSRNARMPHPKGGARVLVMRGYVRNASPWGGPRRHVRHASTK